MISMFRRLRSKNLKEGRIWRYLSYAIGEVILVVIGILIALQVNSYAQRVKERKQETQYLRSILEDIQLDIANNEEIIQNAKNNKIAALNILYMLDGEKPFEELQLQSFRNSGDNDTLKLITSLGRAGFMMLPQVYDNTFEDLKNSGKTGLLTNGELRKSLYRYYGTLDRITEWNGIKRDAHGEINKLLSQVISHDLRSWSSEGGSTQHQLWLQSRPDPIPILEKLRNTKSMSAAVDNMIYTSDRLIVESEWRISLSRRIILELRNELGMPPEEQDQEFQEM